MKITILIVSLTFAVGVLAWARSSSNKAKSSPADVMAGLRKQALTLSPKEVGASGAAHEPFAVIMDIAYPQAVVTVVSFTSGDASIYVSTGGGVIGGGAHESVRKAALPSFRSPQVS